jgi:hypothetical protein
MEAVNVKQEVYSKTTVTDNQYAPEIDANADRVKMVVVIIIAIVGANSPFLLHFFFIKV